MTENYTSECDVPCLYDPYKPVSLWEIMKQFYPVSLLSITESLTHILATLGGQPGHDQEIVPGSVRERGRDIMVAWEQVCNNLGLAASAISVRRTLALLDDPTANYSSLSKVSEELRGRIRDELTGRLFLYVDDATHYIDPLNGWEEVVARFPQTQSDIEESSKCFALNRYAACVFHCMQVIEAALIAISQFLRMSKDNRPSWANVTAYLGTILDKDRDPKKRETLTPFERKNLENLRQLHALAMALQSAWRNKISHAGGRLILLSPDFTPEITEEIMTATRAFVRRLAVDIPPRRARR